MRELISKLEAATEGSRELDGLILRTVGGKLWEEALYRASLPSGAPDDLIERKAPGYALDYTTSLEAALTLVPKGWTVLHLDQDFGVTARHVRGPNGELPWSVNLYRLNGPENAENLVTACKHPHALALCIAALKARSAS